MAAPQVTVSRTPALGIPGQAVRPNDYKADGYRNEEASAGIRPGRFVKKGTLDRDAKVIAGASGLPIGVAMYSDSAARDFSTDSNGDWAPDAMFAVLTHDQVFVVAAGAVTPASEVHLFHTIGTSAEAIGTCGPLADAGKTFDITAIARWKFTAASGDVAVLEVDMTQVALVSADV
jgi:hypothetical protein